MSLRAAGCQVQLTGSAYHKQILLYRNSVLYVINTQTSVSNRVGVVCSSHTVFFVDINKYTRTKCNVQINKTQIKEVKEFGIG